MESLGLIDYKNYSDDFITGDKRYAVRAIILKNGKLAMIFDKSIGMYKFPGGGIKSGEDHIEALLREVNEETGLTVKEETVKEFGEMSELQASRKYEKTVFEHVSYFYFAETFDSIGKQHLDAKEEARGLSLVFVDPRELYENNLKRNEEIKDLREIKILDILFEKGIIK